MKKINYTITTIAISTLIIPTFFVSAENTDTAVRPKYIKIENHASDTVQRIKENSQEKIDRLENQTSSSSPKIQNRIEDIKSKASSSIERVQERSLERLQNIKDKVLQIAKKKSDFLTIRYEIALQQLENSEARIQEAITKLEGKGRDITDAKTAFVLAKAKVESARTALTDIQAIIDKTDISSTTTPKTISAQIKTQNEGLKTLIKEAHSALVGVINSLKSNIKVETNTATTTSTEN